MIVDRIQFVAQVHPMNEPDSPQLRRESAYFSRIAEQAGETNRPELTDRIERQPREQYQVRNFVQRTATKAQLTELQAVLDELWELNDEFAGDRTTEAEAFLGLTGDHHHLVERLDRWSEQYLSARLAKSNPRDGGNPFATFSRLGEEYIRVCLADTTNKGSINYIVLDEHLDFVSWHLFTNTWGRFVRFADGHTTIHWPGVDPRQLSEYVSYLKEKPSWLKSFVRELASALLEGAIPERLRQLYSERSTVLRELARSYAADVQEMRAYLIGGFRTDRTALQLNDNLWVAWQWAWRSGIATIRYGQCQRDIITGIAPNQPFRHVLVTHDGLFAEPSRPWATAASPENEMAALPACVYVLERIHQLLFSFYDGVDFSRIQQRGRSTEADGTDRIQAVAHSCQISVCEPCEEPERRGVTARRIPQLRLGRLLRILESLGCEVGPARGSEVKVFRPGGRIFRFGRHRPDPEISSIHVEKALTRLGISTVEWLDAIGK